MKKIPLLLLTCILLSSCATPGDLFKGFLGTSTKGLEVGRKDALVKIFEYNYETCYAKLEKILKAMPNTSIYAQDKHMIALYYIELNTSPVGVFFKKIDPTHTQVEVSSPDIPVKEWIAKNVFSETVLPAPPESKALKKAIDRENRLGN